MNRLIPLERYKAFLWKEEALTFTDRGRRKYVPAKVAHQDLTVLPSCFMGSRIAGKGTVVRGRHGTGGVIVYFPQHARDRLRRCLESIRKAQAA